MSVFDAEAFKRQLEKSTVQGIRTQLEQGGFGKEAEDVVEAWLQARTDAHQKRLMRSTTIAAWIAAATGTIGLVITALAYFFPR